MHLCHLVVCWCTSVLTQPGFPMVTTVAEAVIDIPSAGYAYFVHAVIAVLYKLWLSKQSLKSRYHARRVLRREQHAAPTRSRPMRAATRAAVVVTFNCVEVIAVVCETPCPPCTKRQRHSRQLESPTTARNICDAVVHHTQTQVAACHKAQRAHVQGGRDSTRSPYFRPAKLTVFRQIT